MQPTKDQIKAWLKSFGHSREWLGQQCGGLTLKAVNNWLSTDRVIPGGAITIISRLMEDDRLAEEERQRKGQPGPNIFSVEVDLETFRAYSRAALDAGQTLEEWAIATCDEEVDRILRGEAPTISKTPIPFPKPYWLDLAGGVAAGAPVSGDCKPEPIQVAKEYPAGHYALRVFGRSMEPKIRDGSTIVVKQWGEGTPKKGTVVVYSDAQGSTLKEFSYRKGDSEEHADAMGNVPILRSLNKDLPDAQTMDGGKIDAVYVETINP